MIRRASLGRYDEAAVQALLERDPDPEAGVRAIAVRAARPTRGGQGGGVAPGLRRPRRPAGPPLDEVAGAFWRPVQHDLLVPWADRYLEQVTALDSEGMMATLSLIGTMQPATCSDDWPSRAQEHAERPETDPMVRNRLLTAADTLSRVLRARA